MLMACGTQVHPNTTKGQTNTQTQANKQTLWFDLIQHNLILWAFLFFLGIYLFMPWFIHLLIHSCAFIYVPLFRFRPVVTIVPIVNKEKPNRYLYLSLCNTGTHFSLFIYIYIYISLIAYELQLNDGAWLNRLRRNRQPLMLTMAAVKRHNQPDNWNPLRISP